MHPRPGNRLPTRPRRARRALRARLRLLRRHPVAWWTASFLLAAAVAVGVTSLLGDLAGEAGGERREVPVARHDLLPGHAIEEADLDRRELPGAAVAPDVSEHPEARVVVERIAAGEPVLESRLAGADVGGSAALIPPGARALAVPIPLGAPHLEPGDTIDLLAVLDPTAGPGHDTGEAVARRARVLEVTEEAVTVAVSEREARATAFAVVAGYVVPALHGPPG